MKLGIKSFAVLCAILWANTACATSNRDNGTALFASSRTWMPLVVDAQNSTWHIDPLTVVLVNEGVWEVNSTAINAMNQFDPEQTVTYRIECAKLNAYVQGWRIGSNFKEIKNELGMSHAKATKFKINPGTVIYEIYNFVCGRKNYNDVYYGLTSFRDTSGALQVLYIKNHAVTINSSDSNLRLIDSSSSGVIYVDCRSRQYAAKVDGEPLVWTPKMLDENTVGGVIISRVCLKNEPYFKFSQGTFEFPAFQQNTITSPASGSNAQGPGSPTIDDAKKKCSDLGFQAGTPKFGECVLKISE